MGIQSVFTENMKKYRKKAKLTQDKLAEICGTDHRYIGQIETRTRCPSLDYVEKIAAALNIAPYCLFFEETTEDGILALKKEQRQKLKAILFENFAQICSIIDDA